MAPGDFAKQYDINSVYTAGTTGTGQSIAIISASNVDLSLVQAYQSLFGLTANLPTVVVDGVDPGQNSAATEAYLDIELAGSVAPGATVLLYTSGGTALTNGLALAAMRAVEDDQAGVISVSYGECEMELGQSGNAFWSALWQQAAAQGQTVFVSSGDGGSAGCDNFDAQQVAYDGLAVNGLASTPYNVAVGGTDFFYSSYAGTPSAISTQLNTYWSTTSTTRPPSPSSRPSPSRPGTTSSASTCTTAAIPPTSPVEIIVAGGGGASSAALYPSGVAAGYAKPAWQTGTGVPADHVRDLPDLSLFAANGYNYSFYPICASPGDCSNSHRSSGAVVITGVGGTSASSPAMAAIQALINQSTGAWAGQADFIYYPLAAKQPTAFHDVTVGGNQVLCYSGTANCVAGSSATNSSGYYVENGYSAGTGYDLATGLGSVDVANLIKYWSTVTLLRYHHHSQRQPHQPCPRQDGHRQRHGGSLLGLRHAHRFRKPHRQRRHHSLRGHRRPRPRRGQLLRLGGQPARRNLPAHRRLRRRRHLRRQQIRARHRHRHSGEQHARRHRLGMESLRPEPLPALLRHHPALWSANLSGCAASERQCHHRHRAHPGHRNRHLHRQAGNGNRHRDAAAQCLRRGGVVNRRLRARQPHGQRILLRRPKL